MARIPTTATAAKKVSRRSSPRLPHERDESADAQQPASTGPDPVADKAFEDAASERADTSLGPVTDRTYRKLKRS